MMSQSIRGRVVVAIAAMICSATFSGAVLGQQRGTPTPATPTRASQGVVQAGGFGFNQSRSLSRSFVPDHAQGTIRQVIHRPVVAQGSETILSQSPPNTIGMESVVVDSVGCASCGVEAGCGVGWDGGCASCGVDVGCGVDACGIGGCTSCAGSCGQDCLVPCPRISIRNMEFFGGVQGFKGRVNRGREGSFGFNAGVNWGFDLPCLSNDFFSGQLGVATVNSNFYESELTAEDRSQFFVTTGLFRRVDCGLQGGVVADILNDNWYTDMTIAQLRGQVSYLYQGGNEIGFWFTSSIQHDTNTVAIANNPPANTTETWQALDQYRVFYTHQLNCYGPGAHCSVFGGATGASDGLFGADFHFPISNCWAFSSGFLYVFPEDTTTINGSINEAWNIGLNLTFYPGGLGYYKGRYARPMFGVADNGTFLIDR